VPLNRSEFDARLLDGSSLAAKILTPAMSDFY